jgi:hypothetical protein
MMRVPRKDKKAMIYPDQPPICDDCREYMTDPHDCPAVEPPPQYWRKIRDGVYGVAISDSLQLTHLGLSRALIKIPLRERQNAASFRFGKEWREGKQRWIEIIRTPSYPTQPSCFHCEYPLTTSGIAGDDGKYFCSRECETKAAQAERKGEWVLL